MAKFVLKNNYFELNSNEKYQISGTGTAFKFTAPCACISWLHLHGYSVCQKFSLGYGSGTLLIFFTFGQLVKKNLMISWNAKQFSF